MDFWGDTVYTSILKTQKLPKLKPNISMSNN